jgi:predicted outer membrane protein
MDKNLDKLFQKMKIKKEKTVSKRVKDKFVDLSKHFDNISIANEDEEYARTLKLLKSKIKPVINKIVEKKELVENSKQKEKEKAKKYFEDLMDSAWK